MVRTPGTRNLMHQQVFCLSGLCGAFPSSSRKEQEEEAMPLPEVSAFVLLAEDSSG